MEKPKGSVYISIGSIGMMALAGIGIMLGPFLIIVTSWLSKIFREINAILPGRLHGGEPHLEMMAGRFIGGIGIVIGIIVMIVAGLQLTFGILTWKKRDDLSNPTFPLAVGIAFTMLALLLGFSAMGLIQLAFPVLLIVGATLNKQQGDEMRARVTQDRAQAMAYPPQSPSPVSGSASQKADPVDPVAQAPVQIEADTQTRVPPAEVPEK